MGSGGYILAYEAFPARNINLDLNEDYRCCEDLRFCSPCANFTYFLLQSGGNCRYENIVKSREGKGLTESAHCIVHPVACDAQQQFQPARCGLESMSVL